MRPLFYCPFTSGCSVSLLDLLRPLAPVFTARFLPTPGPSDMFLLTHQYLCLYQGTQALARARACTETATVAHAQLTHGSIFFPEWVIFPSLSSLGPLAKPSLSGYS